VKFLSDPSPRKKMQIMGQRVRWGDRAIIQQDVDQTCLLLDDGRSQQPGFSFLVLGDTDAGLQSEQDPQWEIAQALLAHSDLSRFTLHTGDVTYPLGATEFYFNHFLDPYRDLLLRGQIYDPRSPLVFSSPFFPVPGNHDYYDLAPFPKFLATLLKPLERWIKLGANWQSSGAGKDYAQMFLDWVQPSTPAALNHHLQQYYNAQSKTGRCLRYQPGKFTRLPNRYYTFHYGGIDFFALDSNTFNQSQTGSSKDIETDREQLEWLEQRLIESWHQPHTRGRVIYLHHPAYTTESLHCDQPEVLTVRRCLRQVFDRVAKAVSPLCQNLPLVNVIFSGHAHCLEHIRTLDTGHADRYLNWVTCGGSGVSLRRQHRNGSQLMEFIDQRGVHRIQAVAQSHLFLGQRKQGALIRNFHTFLRVDVKDGIPAKFIIRPFVVEKQQQWPSYPLEPIVLD
jgi:3',5'-cyclic AMP phosphodiesterase CpdA